jgi:hypothetical protein
MHTQNKKAHTTKTHRIGASVAWHCQDVSKVREVLGVAVRAGALQHLGILEHNVGDSGGKGVHHRQQ